MREELKFEWDQMDEKRREYIAKRKKIRMENEENPKRYVNIILPVNADELNDVFGDILGRNKDGFVLDNSSVRWYYTKGNVEIEDLFTENDLVLWYHEVEMPKYDYGNNAAITKENGEIFRGTINSAPKHKVRKGTL